MPTHKKILLIYTGGTIGMKRSPQGYQPVSGFLTQKLQSMSVMQELPEYDLLEYDPLLDSSNIGPQHWQQMADDIKQHYANYDGFVILHGTDTMAYTASALSFLFENLAKPVILTGAQVPISELHSDARNNLIAAIYYAANYPIPEVCLCFDNQLYRGNRSRKFHSEKFGAFASPNYPKIGHVGVEFELYRDKLLSMPTKPLIVHTMKSPVISCLRLFPGMPTVVLDNILDNKADAILLETYGSGNAPDQNHGFLNALQHAQDIGTVVVNITQCFKGDVKMENYATGEHLKNKGIISGHDMTPEAALTKLMYLFSLDLSHAQRCQKIEASLRGELTEAAQD